MKYALQALPRRPALNLFQGRLLWPALALGGLLFLFVLSVGLALADTQDTVRVPKPDSIKAVRPDSTATNAKQSIFQTGTGRLVGRVTDAKTGRGIAWGHVKILGSKLGCVADTNGTYEINRVPPGKYTVQAMMIGYSTGTRKNVKIHPDLTTVINIKIKQQYIRTPPRFR